HFPAGVVDAASTHVGLGLGFVLPIVEFAADRERERGGHVDEGVDPEIGAAGFEHEHGGRGIGAEAVGEHGARRPSTDDDVVVPFHVFFFAPWSADAAGIGVSAWGTSPALLGGCCATRVWS